VISHSVDREYVRQAFRAGASGYLPKCADPGELPMALESLGRGRVWTSPSVSRPEVQEPSGGRADAAPSRPRPDLTPRQREVLRQIAEGRSTKEIARRLRVSVKTVESHRAQIMERLGIRQVAGLVKYAIRAGIAALHEP
jgi:DNA-binding NarL/FixJ family response regulator